MASRSLHYEAAFEAFLHSPGVAEPAQRLGEHLRFRSSIPAALNEMAILLTARRWTAQFEWYAHRQLGEQAGMAPATFEALASGRRPPSLTADEAAIYDFASALLRDGEVSDKDFAAVRDRFGERGVVDLICTVGYYSTVSMILNVHRHELPAGAVPLAPLKK